MQAFKTFLFVLGSVLFASLIGAIIGFSGGYICSVSYRFQVENLNSSVTIHAPKSMGSGVVFRNKDKVFVWTCHHVIQGAITESVTLHLDSNTLKTKRTIGNIDVMYKLFNDDLDEGGLVKVSTSLLRYSAEDDLALLEVMVPKIFKKGVAFPRDFGYTPRLGTEVFHVGSMGGLEGHHSLANGCCGICGITLDGKCYDRIGFGFQEGSSGGGVFESQTGCCIGLIARALNFSNRTQGYIVPYRRMVDFSTRLDCLWALSSSYEVPEDYKTKMSDDEFSFPPEVLEFIQQYNQPK